MQEKSSDTEDQNNETTAEYMSSKEAADKAIAAIEIVHYDQNNKPSSCNILPLSAYAIN